MTRRILGVGGMAATACRFGRTYGLEGAFVDIDERKRQKVSDTIGVPSYATLTDALAAHDDIAGAYIATPNATHHPLAMELAPLGVPVLMEKPLGVDERQCRELVEAYRGGPGWLQVDFEYRFSTLYAEAGAILHSGRMGRLRSVYLEYTRGGFRPGQAWRLDPGQAGGLFCENLCHIVDLFRFWCRSEPAEMHVAAGPKGIDYYDPRTTDNLVGLFTMENGVFCHLLHTHGSTATPVRGDQHDTDWSDHGHRLAAYLNTDVGCIRLDVWGRRITLIRRDPADEGTPRVVREISFRHLPFNRIHHDISGMVEDFVRRVRDADGPRLEAEDSMKTMLAVFECDRQLQAAAVRANGRFQE